LGSGKKAGPVAYSHNAGSLKRLRLLGAQARFATPKSNRVPGMSRHPQIAVNRAILRIIRDIRCPSYNRAQIACKLWLFCTSEAAPSFLFWLVQLSDIGGVYEENRRWNCSDPRDPKPCRLCSGRQGQSSTAGRDQGVTQPVPPARPLSSGMAAAAKLRRRSAAIADWALPWYFDLLVGWGSRDHRCWSGF